MASWRTLFRFLKEENNSVQNEHSPIPLSAWDILNPPAQKEDQVKMSPQSQAPAPSPSFINVGQRFLAHPAAECGTVIAEPSNGGAYRRCKPVVRGPTTPHVAQMLRQKIAETEVAPPPARVVVLKNATVIGDGLIILPDNKIIQESLINAQHDQTIYDFRRIETGIYSAEAEISSGLPMPDKNYVLLKQRWDGNYGHWLVEGLPRVELLAGSADLSECFFLVSEKAGRGMHKVYTDTLKLYGIREEQIIFSGPEPQHFKALIYPLPLTVQPYVKAPLVVSVLEKLGREVLRRRGHPWRAERLFVCRPKTSRRSFRGQDSIADLLSRRGYAVIMPALMSFEEQVIAFSGARKVVGVLGAECTNIAFSQTGTQFFGLAPDGMHDDFFWDLVSLKKGSYFCLHGVSEDPSAGMNSAFNVDPKAFEELLGEFEAS